MVTLSYILSMFFIFMHISLTLINKNIKYLIFLMLILMWVLYWGSTNNADSDNYLLLYEHVKNVGEGFLTTEIGFLGLVKLSVFFDLSYNQFLLIISFLALSLIYVTIKQYTNNVQYILSLYFIYPFLLDIVQVRHFLAMSIVVYSMNYLEKGKNFRYIIGILMAFSIQFSSIVFLPFLIIQKMKIRQIWIISIIVIIAGMFFVNTSYIVDIVTLIVSMEKVNSYLSNRAKFGYLVQWAIQILYMIPVYIIYKKLYNNNLNEKIIEIVYKINIYILIMFPIYTINLTSSRVFRMTLILNYIVYAIGFLRLNNKYKYTLFFYILLLTIGMFSIDIFFMRYTEVLYPIFNKNTILNLID